MLDSPKYVLSFGFSDYNSAYRTIKLCTNFGKISYVSEIR